MIFRVQVSAQYSDDYYVDAEDEETACDLATDAFFGAYELPDGADVSVADSGELSKWGESLEDIDPASIIRKDDEYEEVEEG